MKILGIGDLHGRKPILLTKDFDAIVLVGDICDDRKIGPLYKKWFRALAKLKSEDTNLDFGEFAAELLGSKKILARYEKESLNVGHEILKYLDSLGKPIFMVGGNWDQSYGKTKIKDMNKNYYNYLRAFFDFWAGDKLNPKLIKGLKNIRNCMFQNHEFNGVNFVGYGLSSGTEDLKSKRKKLKEKGKEGGINDTEISRLRSAEHHLIKKLENAYKHRRNKKLLTFFITHNIPHKTKLDRITDKKNYAYNKHLGSTIAKNFCVKSQPEICVGGHIHDHPGKDKIKRTVVVNPGYGAKAQVLIEIDPEKKKVKSVEFLG